jgi:kynurenine formamidase
MRFIDLTQPLGPKTVLWPGSTPFSARVGGTLPDSASYWRDLAVPEHAGTHVDAPGHFSPGGETVDALALERLVRPAACLDARELCGDDGDAEVTDTDLLAFEAEHGALGPGDVLLVCTGWDRFVGNPSRYEHFPGLSPSAAALAVERGVAGIGIDTLGIEPRHATDFPAHLITQRAGVWHLEALVNLADLPPRGAWIAAAVIPVVEGSGAPARAFAILPD